MEGCFGASFADSFEGLSKLLSDHDQTKQPPAPSSSAVSSAKPGPAGIGPQDIFPGVKVAEPKGKSPSITFTGVYLSDMSFETVWHLSRPECDLGCR